MGSELELELEELKHLQTIATRPRIISLISDEIRKVDKQLSEEAATILVGIKSQPPAPILAPVSSSTVVPIPVLNYVSLSSFSWDQDYDKVKIYVSLKGVDKEKAETDFKPMSIDIKFHDVEGKNYRYVIPKLNKEIVPEKCKLLVKPTRVVITLVKASKGSWLDLQYKEDKLKPNLDKEQDPMAGIMNLMKNMYEEGHEDMKKTINKAWTHARSGKGADPLNRF